MDRFRWRPTYDSPSSRPVKLPDRFSRPYGSVRYPLYPTIRAPICAPRFLNPGRPISQGWH